MEKLHDSSTTTVTQKNESISYMKNALKPMPWETKDKRTIESFIAEYEIYCDTSGFLRDDQRVRFFASFLKEGATITFMAWKTPRTERGPIT